VRRGEMSRLSEAWAAGSNGGLIGACFGDDGSVTCEAATSEVLTGPLQIFLFDEQGNVKRFVFTGCVEGAYERAC
jgi:hypothetical protein